MIDEIDSSAHFVITETPSIHSLTGPWPCRCRRRRLVTLLGEKSRAEDTEADTSWWPPRPALSRICVVLCVHAPRLVRTRPYAQTSDEAGERGPKVKMQLLIQSVSLTREWPVYNQTVRTVRSCVFAIGNAHFTKPKQQGADDLCCIARLKSSGDVGRQQIFSASSAISRGPWPRGLLLLH